MRALRSDVVIYRWIDTKQELSDDDIAELKTFLPKKNEGSRQPSDDKIIIRTAKFSSIQELRMGGKRWIRIQIAGPTMVL